MDQVKIGRFIQTARKEQKLTQKEVAEQLSISDKTVSKWETGNGMPDVSLMLPLCSILKISVNELLSGERLDEAQYYKRAEENMMALMNEKKEAKVKIVLSSMVVLIALLACVTIVLIAGLAEFEIWVRVLLIAIAVVIIGIAVAVACVLDRDAGVFEYTHCGERFIPDMKSYVMAPHTLTRRRLKCPKCGVKSYCKKRLSK